MSSSHQDAASRPKVSAHFRVGMLLTLLCVALVTAAVELVLRVALPMPLPTIGSEWPEQALRYGWGFAPHQRIVLRDPDGGRVIIDQVNNHGWRDVDRQVEAPPSRPLRILVLGDSNTFGVLVAGEDTYTRVLERRLRAEGVDAEVINMALGGWGTDQELEALKAEGVAYHPDIVVLQFCTNDLADNLQLEPGPGQSKPFRYTLDGDGRLVRTSQAQSVKTTPAWKGRAKELVLGSEILKRAYVLYRTLRSAPGEVTEGQLRVDRSRLVKLQRIFGFGPADPLTRFYEARLGQKLDVTQLAAAIDESSARGRKDDILRLSEVRSFLLQGLGDISSPQNPQSQGWRLTLALMEEVRRVAAEAGAPLLLLSDNEEGAYRWDRFWFRIEDGEQGHINYLEPSRILRRFARERGIGFVEPEIPHQRARNDPHPNVEGNRAMAENLYRHLARNFEPLLNAHRRN